MPLSLNDLKESPACINLDDVIENQRDTCDHYRCVICQELPPKPVECRGCGAFFGGQCLVMWLQDHPSCPSCRAPMNVEHDLHIPRNVRKAIQKLSVTCPHQSLGCKETLLLENVKTHLYNGCNYRVSQCDNLGCEFSSLEADLPQHKLVCDFRQVACPNQGCGRFDLRPSEVNDHILHRCWYTTMNCPHGCGRRMQRRNAKNHACAEHLTPRLEMLEDHVRALLGEVRQLRDDKAALIRREALLLQTQSPTSAKARSLLLKAARKGDAQAAYEYGKVVQSCSDSTPKVKRRGLRFLSAAAQASVAEAWAYISTLLHDEKALSQVLTSKLRATMTTLLAPEDVEGDKLLLDNAAELVPWLQEARAIWKQQQQTAAEPQTQGIEQPTQQDTSPHRLQQEEGLQQEDGVQQEGDTLVNAADEARPAAKRSKPDDATVSDEAYIQEQHDVAEDVDLTQASSTSTTFASAATVYDSVAFLGVASDPLGEAMQKQQRQKLISLLCSLCALRLDPKHAGLVAEHCHVVFSDSAGSKERRRLLQLAALHGSVQADMELADPKTAHNYTTCALYPGAREQHALRTGPMAPNENLAYLQDLADQGMPKAAAMMAANLVFLHPEDDKTEGMYYAERAASAGDLIGCALFAECLLKRGPRTADIKAKAHAWATKAINEPQYGAYVYGKLLACGFGEARDFAKAQASFERVDNPALQRRCKARIAAAKDKRFLEYDTDDDDELANEADLDVDGMAVDGMDQQDMGPYDTDDMSGDEDPYAYTDGSETGEQPF
eukprot:m.77595 g.77595  ORF g.77595 m.77595 type:complete len:780 (+) comp14473_c0_seq1:140-2479(+)